MNHFKHLATMLDCSRNAVMTVDAIKRWIDLTADLGYNALHLYLEDTYEIENEPYFGHLRGRYSRQELREIDDYANSKGMAVIPCIQTLAHVNALLHWPVYQQIQDIDDILLAEEQQTYALVERMFSTLHDTLRTRMINIGMDEAGHLGLGRYLTRHGYQDRYHILMEHLRKVSEIAKKYSFELLMWGDMFFRLATGGEYYANHVEIPPEIKELVPDHVQLVYWDYYGTTISRYEEKIQQHNAIKENCWFAGGLWSWSGYASHNTFSIHAMRNAMVACLNQGVENVIMTLWGDDGAECSKFAMLPSLFYVSQLAKGITDDREIRRNFEAKYSIPFDAFMLLDLNGTANESDTEIINPDKYMLYCDPFMGQFDNRVRPQDGPSYALCAKKLAMWQAREDYGYLFRTQKALCDVLAVKYDLGVRTRTAYRAGDAEALASLIHDYQTLLDLLEKFYETYEAQWMYDNKPHGFDVIDLRLGGLRQRIVHCMRRLQAYVDRNVSCIEELDEPVLDCCCVDNADATPLNQARFWKDIATANVI